METKFIPEVHMNDIVDIIYPEYVNKVETVHRLINIKIDYPDIDMHFISDVILFDKYKDHNKYYFSHVYLTASSITRSINNLLNGYITHSIIRF